MNPENFDGFTIAKLVRIEELTKSTFKNAIFHLMAMWAFLM
jgi:hypothetical protein